MEYSGYLLDDFSSRIIALVIEYIIIGSYTVGLVPEPCGYAVLIVQKTVPCGRIKNCASISKPL
jgi:hypothetical protein